MAATCGCSKASDQSRNRTLIFSCNPRPFSLGMYLAACNFGVCHQSSECSDAVMEVFLFPAASMARITHLNNSRCLGLMSHRLPVGFSSCQSFVGGCVAEDTSPQVGEHGGVIIRQRHLHLKLALPHTLYARTRDDSASILPDTNHSCMVPKV